MGGLAVWLLVLDFNKAAHRGFALFLFFRAGQILVGALRGAAATPAEITYLNQVAPYLIIPIVPAIVYFASHYPVPRGPFKTRVGTGVLVLLTGLAELGYLLDHSLFYTITAGPAASSLVSAGRGFSYTGFGPLILLNGLVLPTIGLLAFLFALDYVKTAQGSPRYSVFLVFAGVTLNALYDGAFQFTSLVEHLRAGATMPGPWGWAFVALPSLTILPAAAAVVVVITRGLMTRDHHADSLSLSFLILSLLPIATALVVALTNWGPSFLGEDGQTAFFFSVVGVWRLTLPVLVAYSLLRYHLFGLDQTAKRTIQYGTVAGFMTVAFFLVGELAEKFFTDIWSSGAGLFAAAGLAIAFRPLERIGDKVAHRILPHAKPLGRLDEKERLRLFEEQFALAVQDGNLTAKERAMLLKLQRRLGLVEVEAGIMRAGTTRLSRG